MSRLKDEDNVEDAVQNTIFNAYLNIEKLRNTKFFKSWIIRILINECNRIYRNFKKDEQLLEKCSNNTIEYTSKILEFDDIIEILDENKKKYLNFIIKKN